MTMSKELRGAFEQLKAAAGLTEAASTYFGGVGSKAGEEFGGAFGRGGAKVLGLSKEAQERAEAAGRWAGRGCLGCVVRTHQCLVGLLFVGCGCSV